MYIPDFTKRPVSYSSLKAFVISPLEMVEYYKAPRKVSPAMNLGSMVDMLVFTPDKFEERYEIYEKFEKRSNAAKEKWEQMCLKAKEDGKTLVTDEDLKEAKTIKEAIFRKKSVKELLDTMTQSQERIKWVDKKTGIECVTIPDAYNDELCIDLKISASAYPDDWKRYFFGDSDLTLQVGFLVQGFASRGKFPDFKNVVVNPSAPYDVSINLASEETLKFCAGRFRKYMDKLAYCIKNKKWNEGYEFHSSTGEFIMEVPGYLRQELENYV